MWEHNKNQCDPDHSFKVVRYTNTKPVFFLRWLNWPMMAAAWCSQRPQTPMLLADVSPHGHSAGLSAPCVSLLPMWALTSDIKPHFHLSSPVSWGYTMQNLCYRYLTLLRSVGHSGTLGYGGKCAEMMKNWKAAQIWRIVIVFGLFIQWL